MELLNRRREMGSHLPYDYEVEWISGLTIQLPSKIESSNFVIKTKVYIKSGDTNPFSIYNNSNNPWSEVKTTRINYDSGNILYYQLFGNVGNQNTINSSLLNNIAELEIGNYYIKNVNTGIYYFNKEVRTNVAIGNRPAFIIFRGGNHRYYYGKYIFDNVVVCDFKPVVLNSLGYLYDKVTRTLFGDGSTVYGPRISSGGGSA